MARERQVVWISSSNRAGGRRYHLTPECASLIVTPIAAFDRGKYGVIDAGFRLCVKCAWKLLRGLRPTCRAFGPVNGKRGPIRCALPADHKGQHYCPAGFGKDVVRW